MIFPIIIIGLFILSFVWALVALKREQKTHKRVVQAKKELRKEKILFKR